MARKIKGFERVLEAPALFAIAYGEIASSIYFALGIVASVALGLTPLVLAASGALFLLVVPSYAEGTAAIPEMGGASTFTRRAFNDLVGFATGWVLLLDFLIVMALSALFVPHYLGATFSAPILRESPWDAIVAVSVIAAITTVRLIRRSVPQSAFLGVAILDLAVQVVLVILGMALIVSPSTLVGGFQLSGEVGWSDLAYALPLAMLAYTGLETVANLAKETREPGKTLPRSLFSSTGLVVVLTVLTASVGIAAFPVVDGETELGTTWLEAPVAGIAAAFEGDLPSAAVSVLRVVVGISGVLILLAAATTSVTGATRITHSMGEHGQLPHEFSRIERRSLVSSEAIVLAALLAVLLLVLTEVFADGDPLWLASLYSFGILLAFTAAQLAVIRLRRSEPDLERPFRARPSVRIRGVELPLPALVGVPLTSAVWILAMITHPGARYAGPAWLLVGLAVYLVVRARAEQGVLEDVEPVEELPPGAQYRKALVPMKLGDIGEEMIATAIALAHGHEMTVEALYVVPVPRKLDLDAPLAPEIEERARASMEEAAALGADHGVEVTPSIVKARDIGHAIVEEATARGSDVIVLGSAPRWRRQSRFFSPTVDYVLRKAPCQVLVVGFPDGVFEQ